MLAPEAWGEGLFSLQIESQLGRYSLQGKREGSRCAVCPMMVVN